MERDRPDVEGMERAGAARAPDEVVVEGDPADDDRFGDDRNMRDPGAIRAEPLRHTNERVSCVDPDRCLPWFVRHDGCSMCIAVCPFHQRDYDSLHECWLRHRERARALQADPPAGFPDHLRRRPLP